MITKKASEKGQVVIFLMMMLIVVMIAAAVLVIDGGMVYSDRRTVQNSADASTMAAVGVAASMMDDMGINSSNFKCPSASGGSKIQKAMKAAENAAISQASTNNFSLDNDLSDNMGVDVTCHVDDLGSYTDVYLDVRVMLNLDTHTSFAHMVTGQGTVTNTVESVARVRPRNALGQGYAIIAVGPGCAKSAGGIEYDGGGNGYTLVTGGGVFSHTCIVGNGGVDMKTQCDAALYPGCTTRPPIHYMTTFNGNTGFVPTPDKVSTPLPIDKVELIDCNHPSATRHNNKIQLTNNETFTFPSGLNCLYDGIKATGGTLTGTDVTLVLMGGDFDVNGQTEVILSAPDGDDTDNDGDGIVDEISEDLPALRGMLIYVPQGTESNLQITGGSTSQYTGTVYAPSSNIEVGGNSGLLSTVGSQLIGKYIKLNGTVTVDIRYVKEFNYSLPPKMELQK